MKNQKTKILFVCMGNICRSPAAENVFRHFVKAEGVEDQFEIDSAGTVNFHTGNPPDSRMTEAAKRRGIPMTGTARQVKSADFMEFDWILTMDDDNYLDLLEIRSTLPHPTAKLVKFCDFCENFDEDSVPDPYYGGADGFELVLNMLEDGCSVFLKKLLA